MPAPFGAKEEVIRTLSKAIELWALRSNCCQSKRANWLVRGQSTRLVGIARCSVHEEAEYCAIQARFKQNHLGKTRRFRAEWKRLAARGSKGTC
ncbi:hypothetical protein MPNT_320002 [Candidatus Methylacidithermus pantelleriae]|uniref:Uncharacterized protein n=1 Tax=Candidatus Methylacidithermus pantelleriae TaxID=2744239 RepID=A0A8J2FT07_9BACT|nr:hypothetical protein MPNT_320002 [Candidatus Methylacidithermus pantelleriae]